MKWFRLYSEVMHDPKVQSLRPELFKFWINLLCLASENDPRGKLPKVADIAMILRVRVDRVERFIDELMHANLVVKDVTNGLQEDYKSVSNALNIYMWDVRQPLSDHSQPRVRRHREKTYDKTGVPDVTGLKRECNGLDSDSDSDTEAAAAPACAHEGDPDPASKADLPPPLRHPPEVMAALRKRAEELFPLRDDLLRFLDDHAHQYPADHVFHALDRARGSEFKLSYFKGILNNVTDDEISGKKSKPSKPEKIANAAAYNPEGYKPPPEFMEMHRRRYPQRKIFDK